MSILSKPLLTFTLALAVLAGNAVAQSNSSAAVSQHNDLTAAASSEIQQSPKPNAPAPTASGPVTLEAEPAGAIQDNSFLVEEAYNQEDGVIQHISFFQRLAGTKDWVYTFTDEWPFRTQKHQLSITAALTHSGGYARSGMGSGDTVLNYRYQLLGTGETKYAVSPRLSLVIPSGDSAVGRGYGGAGLQTNLPFSIQHSKKFVTHWNAGATWIPKAKNDLRESARVVDVNLGQSMIYQVSNRFNLMLETVWYSSEDVVGHNKTDRSQDIFMNPGVRWAYNFKSGLQVVPGVSVPVGVGPSTGEKGVIFYLSFEHPFGWSHSRK